MTSQIPDKPKLEGLEDKWAARWEESGVYRFDRSKTRAEIYSIDTPPPTVSGSLHNGHCCSYTHTDTIARFHRMRGREVFYPMGWDDNGLNVERRVQLTYGVICDARLPYDAEFTPPATSGTPVPVSRPNFIELCDRLTTELEDEYFRLWTRLGLSVDWTQTYTTIGRRAQKASQLGFLKLLASGIAYTQDAPTIWDVDYRTAIGQAELEDREVAGTYHRITFPRVDGNGAIEIETTRPEMIPACVALVAHPDDARYRELFGTQVETPIFRARVPVLAHALADPEKGTGAAMICTFGDVTDVVWWRELQLPVRGIVGEDGKLHEVPWGEPGWESEDAAAARDAYQKLVGTRAVEARRRIAPMLLEAGRMIGEPRPITHQVKFWENGENPLEIITNRQWFIRVMDRKDTWLARGAELRWVPEFMHVRYQNWVNGLNGDWNIARQRYFGVPFPCWYRVDADGATDWDNPILPAPDRLPIDPSTDAPDGSDESERGQPDGFVGDPNVMDTWATSSLSPQIVGGWADDPDLYSRVSPYDLRPQAHDIIRTWLFSTVVRSEYEEQRLPWKVAQISGFVNDPERRKLSKSRANDPDSPFAVLEEFGSDAVRYWACGGKPGLDLDFDRNQLKIGRRLAIKLLNASRFALGVVGEPRVDESLVRAPLDRSMLAQLAIVTEAATDAFEAYDYSRARERTESFFWSFCDDYLELVKGRAYGALGDDPQASARAALHIAVSTVLRLFAPILPYVTEEIWSWQNESSIHRAPWPDAGHLAAYAQEADPAWLAWAGEALSAVRKEKTEHKLSMRAPVNWCLLTGPGEVLRSLAAAEGDLKEAGAIGRVDYREVEGQPLSIALELGEKAG